MYQLILGNVTFSEFSDEEKKRFITNAKEKAIVHEIYGIINCETKEQAHEIGENLVNDFLSFIIPKVFQEELGGEIAYECEQSIQLTLNNKEQIINKLGDYISGDCNPEETLATLINVENKDDMVDNHITILERFEHTLLVKQLLEQIGYSE